MESIGITLYVPGAPTTRAELVAAGATKVREVREAGRIVSFELQLSGGAVVLTVMSGPEFMEHRAGLEGFVAQACDVQDPDLPSRLRLLTHALGVLADDDVDVNEHVLPLLQRFAGARGAMAFMRADGLLDADGEPLATLRGPAGDDVEDPDDAERDDEDPPERTPPTVERVVRRAYALAAVVRRGLIEHESEGREAEVGAAALRAWLERHGLWDELEPAEAALLTMPPGDLDPQATINAVWRAEGVGVLAWALGRRELPPHDEVGDVALLERALDAGSRGRPALLDGATLRSTAELEAMQRRLLTVHWRTVDFRVQPRRIDFPAVARQFPAGFLDLAGLPLAEGDLAIGGLPIDVADEESVDRASSIAVERHLAIEWLLGGHPLYSEVDAST